MSSTTDEVNRLNAAAASITLALTFGSLIPGSIGLVLNVLVFTRRSLRNHSCSMYFLASTCVNLFVLFVVLPVRIASNSFSQSLSDHNEALCRIEYFLFYTARSLSCWLIVLVCIDRYIHSIGNMQWHRRLSSPRVAKAAIAVTGTLIVCAYSHMPIYYSLMFSVNQNGTVTSFCTSQKGVYRLFSTLWHIGIYSVCPSTCMFILGVLTLINIRRQRRRVTVISDYRSPPPMNRRTDMQMLRMLTLQASVIITSTIPGQLFILYQTLDTSGTKSTLRQAQERVMAQSLGGVSYISHASSFYLYTLTGTIFRKELIRCFSRVIRLFRATSTSDIIGRTLPGSKQAPSQNQRLTPVIVS